MPRKALFALCASLVVVLPVGGTPARSRPRTGTAARIERLVLGPADAPGLKAKPRLALSSRWNTLASVLEWPRTKTRLTT
jgi:hypothetical protein